MNIVININNITAASPIGLGLKKPVTCFLVWSALDL